MAFRARLFALSGTIMLSAALVAGCSGDSNAASEATGGTRAPNPPAVAPSGAASDDAPGTTATANGVTVDMGIGTHCWVRMCVDMIGPITKDTLRVARGDIIEVAVPLGAPALRDVSAIAFRASTPTDLDSGAKAWPLGSDSRDMSTGRDGTKVEVDVDLPPGVWILSVGMFFEQGDISYAVVLEVR
jgi:hypothetical protein